MSKTINVLQMDFKNKVILITGASRGIGKATAQAFAKREAQVIINYKQDHERAKETLDSLEPGNHFLIQADVSKPDELESMFDEVIRNYKQIDVLVNNAGIGIFHPVDDISFDSWQHAWQQVINTNLMAVANSCYLAAQHMIKRRSGRIVNVSSRGAFRGEPQQPAYGASKAGVNALSQSLAKQLGGYGIYVMAVAPGFVETDMATEFLTDAERIAVENDSPLKRMARPEEVANAIVYLASEDSAFSTGAILDINGASYLRT
jgi:NAD(P)-dependent dehydrogenase (short-subunit alcohol dehydrogenase family)